MSKNDKGALNVRNEEALAKASPLLDQISNNWLKIEALFQSKGILKSVVIDHDSLTGIDQNGEEHEIGCSYLGIQKLQGSWKICYGEEMFYRPETGIDWTPVTETPSTLRIELLDQVNPLFEALVKSNEEYVAEIEQAAKKSKSILTELEKTNL